MLVTDTIVFQQERLTDCLEEARPLLEAHWREIAHYQDIALDPEWTRYELLEQAGNLRIFTFRESKILRGYAVFVVNTNMHYRQSLQAVQDILWLDPALRKQMLGARFIQWCDEALQRDFVQVVYQHVKLSYDFGPTLQRLGYEPIEMVWGKRLDRGR